ncbi:uncharacterized protein V1516DRAFT_675913 [Lipomyces oligophaga]|uniref:uncharacterized protein n=1 Tax=Lipomyces oligophaga TaxID=45792 RepID=UPI0034CFE16C
MKPRKPKPRRGIGNTSLPKKSQAKRAKVGKPKHHAKSNAQLLVTNKLDFYAHHENILLVGEGDFSFTKALLEPPHSLAASRLTTSVLDSKEELLEKYPDTAQENVTFLETYRSKMTSSAEVADDDYEGFSDNDNDSNDNDNITETFSKPDKVHILYKVDATALTKSKYIRKRKFDCCVFNFPHTGSGITDQDRNILKNQELLVGFLKSVSEILNPNGLVVISLFEGSPYSLWDIKGLAKAGGFESIRSGKFIWQNYPSYNHRKTSGIGDTTKKSSERDARMFIFKKFMREMKTPKPETSHTNDSSDSDEE